MGSDGGGGLEGEFYELPGDPLIAEVAVSDADHDGVIGASSELIGEPAEAFEAGALACADGENIAGD